MVHLSVDCALSLSKCDSQVGAADLLLLNNLKDYLLFLSGLSEVDARCLLLTDKVAWLNWQIELVYLTELTRVISVVHHFELDHLRAALVRLLLHLRDKLRASSAQNHAAELTELPHGLVIVKHAETAALVEP